MMEPLMMSKVLFDKLPTPSLGRSPVESR